MSPERPSSPACPHEVRKYITEMEMLMTLPQYNHSGLPGQLGIHLLKSGVITSFAQLEVWLRGVKSRVHFIGVPCDYFKDTLRTVYPHKPEERPEYTLFVAVDGAEEAQQLLAELGIDEEENKKRLEVTGIQAADGLDGYY